MPVAVPTEVEIETLVLGAGPVSLMCDLFTSPRLLAFDGGLDGMFMN